MPVLARAFILMAFTLLIVGSVVVGIAHRRVNRVYDIPPPPITRATAPDEIARGGRLFRTNCLDCHAGRPETPAAASTPGGPRERRPLGARVTSAPEFMGEVWAPNLTAHPQAGIGAWSDGELARLLRNGLGRDGRTAAGMPRFGRLSNDDVAALVGFLRSDDAMVAPSPNVVPRTDLAIGGTLALAFAAGVDTHGEANVPMPARGPSADYGRYLATAVYGCVDCHTDGMVPTAQKVQSPQLLAGGMFLRTPRGEPIYSANLTPDKETGLDGWTAEDLTRALTTGIGRSGLPQWAPMPVFRWLTPEEGAALFAYLRSVPAVTRKTPGPPRERRTPTSPPEDLVIIYGCTVCHGDRAPHQALLKQAASARSAADLGASIRNPEARVADSQMPTYAAVIDEVTAIALGTWIKDTGGNLNAALLRQRKAGPPPRP
jgi:mono/diheme cytochrome c family protein